MFKLNLFYFCIFGLISVCVGQYLQDGTCPDAPLQETFDIEQFLGTWYEVYRSDNPNQPGDCAKFTFSRANTGAIVVDYDSVAENFAFGGNGTATQETGTPKLTLNISPFPNPINFWVQFANYAHFSLVYSCENLPNTRRAVYIWVLGRGTTINEISFSYVNATLANVFGINVATLRTIDHSDNACITLPVIEPGQPIVIPGQCDSNIPVVQNFDAVAFTGRWHEIASYETVNSNGNCIRAEYSLNGGVVNVVNTQVINGNLFTITGNATVTSSDGSAKLTVVLDVQGVPVTQDLWIIGTDYNNYAVSYSCINVSQTQKQVVSWILSRTRQISETAQTEVDRVVDSFLDLNRQYYKPTDQSDASCFYYPDPVPGVPVNFRGQCASVNVQAMPNFNAAAYLGLWHNIEMYPTPFQDGTCSNAFYSLDEASSGVLVYNTQVKNQTLDTINAYAVVASDDGSAKLRVTFPVAGTDQFVTSDYWVLNTDYVTYAFVYSCANIDPDTMSVASWKLSRIKQLNQFAQNQINTLINSVSVLDQRYFETVDQSPEACFYFPDPQPGVPVEFPGECDNIAAVPNFSMAQFQGVWHEIEAYPKLEQPGQCINHDFTLGSANNLFDLQSSSIYDQALTLTSSNVRNATNDGSGKLIISISSANGTALEIPFWILSTDYTDYALAYSCVERGDRRGVWSWKLSRTKQLSTQANQAINSAIAGIQVLDQRYYETIDQTDRACFYFPDLAPGEAVILPGQCDDNISGVANFSISRYAGRWRLIQSYPSDFQVGTCNIARYTLQSSDTLGVTNSQVVNQELRSLSGTARISSNDGSGKLLFSYGGTRTFEFTVLATDYDSYAVGYGCVNVNTEQRRVYSWKLSRENTLSSAAATIIDEVINSVDVLNNRYYYTVDRTVAGCFFYPTPDSNTTVIFPGQCDESIPVVTNFQAAQYLGLWHDVASYPTNFQDGTCNNAYYTAGNDVDVYNTQVINQTLFEIRGSAALEPSSDGSAKLIVTFVPFGQSKYWVLATDYSSYSVVYSCLNVDDEFQQVTVWKLSRTKTLTPVADAAINNVLNIHPVLDQRYFLPRDQSPDGCFYFPEPQPGVPVVFPGQCDNNIVAVPNFDFSRFQGVWHEVEAYPKAEQPGLCINHQFTLSSTTNVLNLQSSSVYDKTLSLTSGNIRNATNDGSGRLIITIPSGNGTDIDIPFWILSTDYTDYALAYSCVEDGDYRGVWSWKLSRSKQLSAQANQAINSAISDIQVLDQRYYENIDQTDPACFYLPDLQPGDAVVLPGQCDNNISGVPNFNIARYAGRWRLIESYGSNFQTGTCNIARYTLEGSDSLSVINSQVVDQDLRSISGTARINSTDGSGKLLFYYPSRDQSFEFTVLATDYDSYALGYGCININSEQRRVYSWKLSRDNTLSQTAINSINQIVNSIDVLHQPYYYTVNRTDNACFYYPTPDTNTTVIFPGQCDENVRVVTNFNAAEYLGLWHDIESYPENFQDGTCNNAYYSPGNDVDVYNTQVINQTLFDIRGSAVLLPSSDGSAKLDVTFNVAGIDVTRSYWVLATDYNSYALVYSCTNIDDEFRRVYSWKLSRTKALTATASAAITAIQNNYNVLDQRYFLARDQSPEGCFYFPEPEPGVPVVFPGQCDDTIAAVPSFNMTAFAGRWHEITAYPKEEQSGQCISHEFVSNSANSLSLQSLSIINQALSTTSGEVTFATNDGSGRLNIVIRVGSEVITIPYWILSTDYIDYALAYSCVNINSDYRGVWSWKLSRSKQLSAVSNIAINERISNIPILDNRYYEDISQTDSDCFYYPELGPTDPVEFPGQCDPNIPVVQNFNAAAYLGEWRLIESYYSNFQEGTCNTAHYYAAENGSVIVNNTEIVNETLTNMIGLAVLASTDGSAKLSVTFPDSPVPIDYWVLDTDYETYSLVYSCFNVNNERRRIWSWKLSRTNTLTQEATNNINQVVNSVDVLDARYYQTANRSDAGCFYYPTPDPDTFVNFPGQCDLNIPVVPNFNSNLYAGDWYVLENYPSPFYTGTCNKATYTVTSENTLNLTNTQVNEQILETLTASLTVAADGSGKLDVAISTPNGQVINTSFWILATDYTSYALVYVCQNVGTERREVYSVKYSREQTLSNQAATAINNVINSIQVLDQQYYVTRNHSEEACFYYPNNNGGDVILNGQCVPNAQVPAMSNFNANLFAGTWHEVARFPSTLQNGECSATEYSVNGTQFDIVKTSVIDEELLTTSTLGTLAGDNRGVINININGVPFNEVYILDSDYNEYALAYSCRNLPDDKKQVYSWKLSRSREGLSQGAREKIDELVSNNIDLFELYYRYTDQGNEACFYYPTFDQPPAVIELPGPCNTTISGISNFNATAYLGRWFEHARYPQRAQNGQCNRAEYSAGETAVQVVNSQVVDMTLDTITGTASVASNDGSAELEVTFIVNGETRLANYYVLATDYNDYALVYNCRNLDNGWRQVGSWKLSRSRTLSSEANTVMDAIIARTQGLLPAYYQPTSQSDESCFYVPPVDTSKAPLFRGQCEEITGVENFDVNRYLGWWHEIERYPRDGNVGECISSNYELINNNIQVVDTSVFDLSSETTTATVTVTNDGRIRRTRDGSVQDIWVVATDYDNYALLYSCENVNEEYRRVWSAKHSKATSLTQAAQDAMAPVIASNRLLYPQFYQAVDQSESACFHYPAQTGASVILRGQCDENIPVQANFNMAAFARTWYHTERYDPVQSSSCVGTRFVFNAATNDINVIEFEVVGDNEALEQTNVAGKLVTEGSGTLSIDRPYGGQNETILYVLNTDYENYALVYTCVNINQFQRQVGAWKLSSTRTLSAASNTAINAVISQREELHQPYFNTIPQNDNCPEPSSAFLFKSSIIVILVCALLQLVL